MYLDFEVKDKKLIVHMLGELDHHSAEEVRNKIDDRVDRAGITKVILDFSGVTFMDSSGIGVVIGRYKRLTTKKGDVCVTNVKGAVNKVFELSGLYKIIKLYGSIEQAVNNI